jgi:hypothetical protein
MHGDDLQIHEIGYQVEHQSTQAVSHFPRGGRTPNDLIPARYEYLYR